MVGRGQSRPAIIEAVLMKVSLRWLQEFIDLPTSDPEVLSLTLAMIGHEVDGYQILDIEWSNVVVGQVRQIADHPDADKIRVCQVDTGSGAEQIICGAWNFGEGAHVAVARPGAILPGGVEIGRRTIRGVESHGMICSEKELGLGEDHAGILVLDATPEIGTDFGDLVELPDVVFDLSITPNRGDAMSLLGIARDLAAYFNVSAAVPERIMSTVPGTTGITVEIADPEDCFRFTAREIRGVHIGRSPLWVRHRLRKAGVRSISNVVDVTNYVMLELGQPQHAFDAGAIEGGHLSIHRAKVGESLVTLDDVERRLGTGDLIIYDADGPTSMAGTMGGARSEVSSRTRDILLEAATWDPPTIMYMSRRHGLRSEASTRFERGVDPELTDLANRRAASMVVELAGGEVLEGHIDVVAKEQESTVLTLPLPSLTRLLGPGFTSGSVRTILTRLGMEVSGDEPLHVNVPSYRLDVTRPVDLVEEVARIHGYDNFGSTVPLGVAGGLTVGQKRERALNQILTRAGLSQAVTLPFVREDDLVALERGSGLQELVRVKNPLSDEEGRLRPTMLPNLLRAVRYNISHGNESTALFETGSVFRALPYEFDPRLPEQVIRLSWAITGGFGQEILGVPARRADADLSLAIFRLITDSLLLKDVDLRQSTAPGFHPGRAALVTMRGVEIGHVGELSPAAGRHFDLPDRVAIAELDLAPFLSSGGPAESVSPSVFPFVDFDLSFVIPDVMPVAELVAATRVAAGDLLEDESVFDEFRDETMGDDKRAVAIRYRLRAADRTLSSDEVKPVRQAMIDAAGALGAMLRGV